MALSDIPNFSPILVKVVVRIKFFNSSLVIYIFSIGTVLNLASQEIHLFDFLDISHPQS
jgi:hypothetical protein